MKGKILVFIQFSAIFLMSLPLGAETIHFNMGSILIFVGATIGIAAIYKNRLHNFNIVPEIKDSCILITDGIYAYIRHPMYTSVLVTMLGVVFLYMNSYEVVLYLVLLINMLIKMFYEESLWHCEGDEYKEYSQKTSRLIPFIF